MTKLERIILKDLYESVDGLFAYTFYSRYKIEPDEIFLFINKYVERRIVEFDGNKISLTKEGKEIILKQKFGIPDKHSKFAGIPKEFLAPVMKINKPFLPNISEVPKEILKKRME